MKTSFLIIYPTMVLDLDQSASTACVREINRLIVEYGSESTEDLRAAIAALSGMSTLSIADLGEVCELVAKHSQRDVIVDAAGIVSFANGIVEAKRTTEDVSQDSTIPVGNPTLFRDASLQIRNIIRTAHISILAKQYNTIRGLLYAASRSEIIQLEKITGNDPLWEPLHTARIHRLLAIIVEAVM